MIAPGSSTIACSGLARATGASDGEQDPNSVRLVEAASLTPGLAILDAPDIDSVVSRNRDLGAQLLAAADMWVFVTTAARYADAVPWDLLATAGARGTSVAVVLDRIPPAAQDEIRRHLASMLAEHRLGDAPVFVVPEVTLDPCGLLPGDRIGPLRDWLLDLASDQQRRAAVVQRTSRGARCARGAGRVVTAGVGEQSEAIAALLTDVQEAYDGAAAGVEQGMSDGTLLRGEVLARWQEYVGTSEVFRQLESALARLRDRISAALTGKPQPARPVGEALQTGAAALIIANAEAAASTRDAGRATRRVKPSLPTIPSRGARRRSGGTSGASCATGKHDLDWCGPRAGCAQPHSSPTASTASG